MENALFLLQAFEHHFHDINQDLVDEVFTCLSMEKHLVEIIERDLLEKPSLITFKLAVSMGITLGDEQKVERLFSLVLESDNPPNLMCYLLQLLSIELSKEQWNAIMQMDNLLVCRYAVEYAQRCLSLEAKERLLLQIDFSNPTALLLINKLAQDKISLIIRNAQVATRSVEELMQAIHRAAGFNQSLSGCSCSKHYECHDY